MCRFAGVGVVIFAVLTSACGGGTGGTIAPTSLASSPETLSYAINIPDRQAVQYLLLLHPGGGLFMAPVEAQRTFDATAVYGRPNVYAGERVNPAYAGAGIVVAAYAVASKPRFLASEWPDEFGRPFGGADRFAEYAWFGHFTYTEVGRSPSP